MTVHAYMAIGVIKLVDEKGNTLASLGINQAEMLKRELDEVLKRMHAESKRYMIGGYKVDVT